MLNARRRLRVVTGWKLPALALVACCSLIVVASMHLAARGSHRQLQAALQAGPRTGVRIAAPAATLKDVGFDPRTRGAQLEQ